MAFANSGDVLHVQKMLYACVEHLDEADAMHQAVAVLGIGMIAMGEEIGTEMALRSLDHILQYGELPLRRAVPIALAVLHFSNPKVNVIDSLSKLSHDADQDVAMGAIISMGLIGAGTNNARLAGLLRQLAAYYAKDANSLFMVRIAQGLLYMGKGLLSLNPLFSDRFLLDPIAFGSLAVLAHDDQPFVQRPLLIGPDRVWLPGSVGARDLAPQEHDIGEEPLSAVPHRARDASSVAHHRRRGPQ